MGWDHWVLQHEVTIRLSFFLAVFGLVALWEALSPRRARHISRWLRWSNNLGLVALNSLVLRLLFPAAAVGVAATAAEQGWGLLNLWAVPPPLAVLLSVVLLDFAIYLQHVMFHAVPLFWRLHQVHHADPEYDVTTGTRFHTLEIILSLLIKFAVLLVLGPPVVAVVIFEVLLNATAMFNHGNIRLPARVDRYLRLVLVTPDMHRVHHSVIVAETNSNFGFNLPWWDRLCGTYRAQPRAGHIGMRIGLKGMDDPAQVSGLPGMLAMPFRRPAAAYPINAARRRGR